MLVLGVDGCRDGWISVQLEDRRLLRIDWHARFAEILAQADGATAIGVDMPIGLLPEGWRECETEARAFLGRKRSSIFLVPPRSVVEAPDYATANARCRELTGKGLSKQAYALAPKILEVDACARLDERLHEVHPEVAFQTLRGAPLAEASKKTWSGVRQRLELLQSIGLDLPAELGRAGRAAPDDVLDAAIVAWSADRIARGEARSYPAEPRQRRNGDLPIAIWA